MDSKVRRGWVRTLTIKFLLVLEECRLGGVKIE